MQDLALNEKKTVELAAKDAYGEFNKDAIQVASRENFPKEAKLEIGMEYMASMENGQHMPFVISKIDGDEITVDFNHPLAGQDLTFEVEITEIREATAEELEHGHVHGPGGHHH
jgi:FKBP-type peptidyl-prolyl cis-trans isomerase SlyD